MPYERLRPSFVFTEERITQLRDVVPEAFADGKVNWGILRESLGDWLEETGDEAEHFGLTWPGKREARRIAAMPSQGTLRPSDGEGVNEASTHNLFIEGDNLEVLKLLQKSYSGMVKMIYIDPPYNTGNDFVYEDDFSEPLESYLRRTGQLDEEGRALTTNTRADGRFHSKWLSMMYPRLRLARSLLRAEGVLFVSCNDEEQAHLKLILLEIFGEENFVATFVWNNEGNIDNQSKVKSNHEYIHCVARSIETFPKPSVIDPNIEESSKLYNDEIENSITKNGPANPPSVVRLPIGFPAAFDHGRIDVRRDKWPHIHRAIVVSEHKLSEPAEVESGWSSRNLLQLFVNNGCVPIRDSEGKETRFAVTASGAIYGYKKRSDNQGHVLTVIRNVGTTKQNSIMLSRWGIEFDWPKPVMLLRYLVQIATSANDIVLDYFAGSCTTAQGVISANDVDGGSRRFICVQLPEPMSSGTHPTIAEVGKHRIRSVLKEARAEQPADTTRDLGFRVLKLERSNFRPWTDYEGDNIRTVIGLFDNAEDALVDGWTPEGLVTEIMLTEGFALDACIRTLPEFKKNAVTEITSDYCAHRLVVCLDEQIYADTVNSLAVDSSDIVVCLDKALTDEAKVRLADRCLLKTI